MDRDSVYALISKLLVELFGIEPADITPTADIFQDLNIDSIDAVDFAVEFKKQTGRQFSPDEFKKIRTINDILDAVCKTAG